MLDKRYSDKVIEHFMCPKNAGKMPDADAEGTYGDLCCGDAVVVYIQVQDYRIRDIRFLAFGGMVTVAAASVTTELARGKTLEDALKISEADVAAALDGLPDKKRYCAMLGAGALQNAVVNYRRKTAGNSETTI